MGKFRIVLLWTLALVLSGALAASADQPATFVVYPEAEVSVDSESSDFMFDRLFNKPVVTPVVAEAYYEADCCPDARSVAQEGGCSLADRCAAAVGCQADSACVSEAWIRFDSDAKSVLPADNPVDGLMKKALAPKDWFEFPVNVGGWHWWNIDTGGVGNGGYGAAGFRGTYAYYVIGQPSVTLEDGSKIGGFVFFAGRDGDPYRSFYSRNFWFLEGYASYSNDEIGTIKGGLVNNKFGLDGYLGFIGTAPYFDGFIQDADYGISWEKIHESATTSVSTHLLSSSSTTENGTAAFAITMPKALPTFMNGTPLSCESFRNGRWTMARHWRGVFPEWSDTSRATSLASVRGPALSGGRTLIITTARGIFAERSSRLTARPFPTASHQAAHQTASRV